MRVDIRMSGRVVVDGVGDDAGGGGVGALVMATLTASVMTSVTSSSVLVEARSQGDLVVVTASVMTSAAVLVGGSVVGRSQVQVCRCWWRR